MYSQDVENITTAARLPHDPTEQRAVHLLGYRDSEGKGLTGIERAFDSRLEKAGEPVRVFSERTARILREDMIGVVEQGSATMAKPQQGGAGGKTASAQTGILDEDGEEVVHAWFAGFFPAQQPRYAAVVLIEGGEYGGQVASPIFRQIVDRYGPLEPEV